MVITLYQQDIRWQEPEENRRHAEAALAAAPISDIFAVPETFTTGFGDGMTDLAEEPEGPTLQWARRMAAQHDLLFVGTWIVIENGRCYNRMHWVFPDGDYGTYDKGHTFRVSGEADADADCDEKSMAARRSNMAQLAEYINNVSTGKAVIVFGDTNSRYTRQGDDFYELLLKPCNLKDAWIENVMGGIIPPIGESRMVDDLGQ